MEELGPHSPTILRAMSEAIQEELAKELRPAALPAVTPGIAGHTYRASSVTTEHLLVVLNDPDAVATDRIEAARTLRAQDPSADRAIRLAADTTASPPLRSALLRVAELEDEEVDEPAGRTDGVTARSDSRH